MENRKSERKTGKGSIPINFKKRIIDSYISRVRKLETMGKIDNKKS